MSLRVMFAVGPGDVCQAFEDWEAGIRTLSETSRTFSGQCMDWVCATASEALFISSHPRKCERRSKFISALNLPGKGGNSPSGWKFHWKMLHCALRLWAAAWRFQPKLAVIDSGMTHWFLLWPVKALGVIVVPNFHSVHRIPGALPRRGFKALMDRLNDRFLRQAVQCAIGVSPECGRQFLRTAGASKRFFGYFAQFAAEDFKAIAPPAHPGDGPFQVLFVGRVEESKGVFDLVAILQALILHQVGQVRFVVCGDGSALSDLRHLRDSLGLQDQMVLRGRLNRPQLLEAYAQSHAVIVPTRGNLAEGMPMVCAEAVLAGRPVVSTSRANAAELLDQAFLEAELENISSFALRIEELIKDPVAYAERVAVCHVVSRRFTDRSQGLQAALEKVVHFHFPSASLGRNA